MVAGMVLSALEDRSVSARGDDGGGVYDSDLNAGKGRVMASCAKSG
jgi:hypothetical protein